MTTRLEDVPIIKVKPTTVKAEVYNHIRLGLLRLENPLRLPLAGLRGMDMILTDNAWVCVDRSLYDLPVLAWTKLNPSNRSALHTPVTAQLNFYHIHANVIAETVLSTSYRILIDRLRYASPLSQIEVHCLSAVKQR